MYGLHGCTMSRLMSTNSPSPYLFEILWTESDWNMLRILSFACVLHAIINVKVSGTVMELHPNPIVFGHVTGSLLMNCSLDNNERITPIKSLSGVRILRYSTREIGQNEAVVIAQTLNRDDSAAVRAELAQVSDVQSRNPSVSVEMLTRQTENLAVFRLTWDARVIVCEDMGSYECNIQYRDLNNQSAEWTTTSVLRYRTYPKNLVMTVQGKSNIPGSPPQNTDEGQTENTALEFNEGDVVNLKCTGVIGDDRNTEIEWFRTRDFSDDPENIHRFTGYGGSLDEGTVPEETENCQYSRTSTVAYTVTERDAARTRPFMFLCRVEYTTVSGHSMTLDSTRKVFIHAGSGNTGKAASTQGENNAGVAAGSIIGVLVFVGLIVGLVYFLWYRKRNR